MQNKIRIWRASNPVFLICCYLLIGVISYKSTSQYWTSINQKIVICILCCSLLLLYISNNIAIFRNWRSILPTILLIIWGICIAHIHHHQAIFSTLANSEWIETLRAKLIHKMDRSFTNQASCDFAKTLLLGTKSNLSNELKSAYQILGIFHIIAISGMHLDLLFRLLEKGTNWLPPTKWASWFKFILLLLLVWTYTCIAHAGPSIVRASIFFSAVLISRFFYLNYFSFNTISTGILLVLIFNSDMISAIGLQLSYAAVIGIRFFHRPLFQFLSIDNQLLKNLWDNLAISIAAQLTTVPLLLYYFHTSSSLSIIGNFIFIPASNFLLYSLLALMVLPDIASIQYWTAKGISIYIEKMNEAIQYVYHLFQADTRFYNLGIKGLLYYFFCLFIGYYWIRNKAPYCFFIFMLGTCIYSLLKLFSI